MEEAEVSYEPGQRLVMVRELRLKPPAGSWRELEPSMATAELLELLIEGAELIVVASHGRKLALAKGADEVLLIHVDYGAEPGANVRAWITFLGR